jgi:hypothetical protein
MSINLSDLLGHYVGKYSKLNEHFSSGWRDLNPRPLVPQIWIVTSLLFVTFRFSGIHESLNVCEGRRKATFMKLSGEFCGESGWGAKCSPAMDLLSSCDGLSGD